MNDETHSKALSRRRMMQMAGAAAAGIGLPLATHNSAAADLIPKASTPGTSPGDVFSENALMSDVETMTSFGWRRPGSPAVRDAARWVRESFEQSGLQTHTEEWDFDVYYPSVWHAKVTNAASPAPALPWETNSYPIWYTSAGQVEAEVVHVGAGTARDFDRVDVRGKIAMVESVYLINVMNTDGMLDAYESAVAHGAVGYIRTADAPNNLTRLTHGKGIDKNTFRQRKEASIPGLVLGSDDFNAIRTALGGGPVTMSLEIRTENPPFGGTRSVTGGSLGPGTHELRAVMEDVVGVLPGVSDEIVLIGAHYDSTYGGAMDNGTGVAGMLALMRHYAAKARSERPRTLVFLAAGGHDCGDFDLTHFMQTHLEDMLPRVITFAWLDHLAAAGTIRVTQSSVDIPTGLDEIRGVLGSFNPVLLNLVLQECVQNGVVPPIPLPIKSSLARVPDFVPSFDITTAHSRYHTIEDTIDRIPPASLRQMTLVLRDVVDALHTVDSDLIRNAQPVGGDGNSTPVRGAVRGCC
ncbi:M28 family peptidase [Rhodococcus sp. D-46]|uniref:M28 family peptidase n=1 Tax=Rhodococcus TaxID=1827 RepID=UPI0007E5B369|nr:MULTISPECIES: M28 family peptidase [Rhodococcus]NHE63960.1 M28 family peptidase [Rhodococcus sp. D-46]ARE36671.1 hypothetical protein A0W34_27795 [Rhodococcus sp. BH4]ORC22500.1 hypothetical protein BXO91_19910 [Rhodococcus qingshengii]WNF41570.1 M28 family peptidase [Rhodococcus sp. SG20037]BCF86003.1 hypothetical protein RQCS_55480 [Rhodococcus qingshengii]